MKIFKIHKKESNLNENVQKERVKLTKKKLPMLNNTNDSESCFRALSTAKSRRMTDKKTYDIRSLSLNQNFLHLYQSKLVVKPIKISVTNLESNLFKNIADKGRIRNSDKTSKQIIDINDIINNKRKFSVDLKNTMNLSKDKSFNIHDEIKSNYTQNTVDLIKNIKKDLYINKFQDYSLCEPNKRLTSKLPIAKIIVEERKQKEKKLNFFMERDNPIKEINPKNLINLVSQPNYINQVEMFNREKLKTSVI